MNKFFKWVKEHVRPHVKYHPNKGEEIDWKNEDLKESLRKAKDKTEIGIKFKFKF